MEIKKIHKNDIKPYKYNNKKHPRWHINALKKSISDYGYIQPIMVDKDNIIIAGHGRHKAIMELDNIDYIDVVDGSYLSDIEAKKLRIIDNRIVCKDYDFDSLYSEMNELYSDVQNSIDDIMSDFLISHDDMRFVLKLYHEKPQETKATNNSDIPLSGRDLKIEPYDWLKKFDTVYLQFSGGKDSMASFYELLKNGVDKSKIKLLWCRTPLDYSDLESFVENFAKHNSVDLIKLNEFEDNYLQTIFEKNGLPTVNCRWCTTAWKIHPTHRFLKARKDKNIVTCMGWRKEENVKRRASDIRCINKITGVAIFRPILDFSEKDVFEIIRQNNGVLHNCYKYHDRLGCIYCFAKSREAWIKFQEHDTPEFLRALKVISYAAKAPSMTSERYKNAVRKAFGLETLRGYREIGETLRIWQIKKFGYFDPFMPGLIDHVKKIEDEEKRKKYLRLIPILQKQRKTLLQRFRKSVNNSVI